MNSLTIKQPTKLNRNDYCYCNSYKKYKKCCYTKDLEEKTTMNEQYLQSLPVNTKQVDEQLWECMELFKNYFDDKYKLIDVSHHIKNDNYRAYHFKFANSKTIFFVKKNEDNDLVFKSRQDNVLNDIMVCYNGQYRTFQYANIDRTIKSVFAMIK